MDLFHYSGIGDWFQITSYFTEEELTSLDTITWASKAEPILRPVMESSQVFGKVKHRTLWLEVDHHFTRHDDVPWEVLRTHTSRFHPILSRRKFRGCPILRESLCDLTIDLPARFAYIHPTTPHNHSSRYAQAFRDMHPAEWEGIFRWLDEKGLVGVVVNSKGGAEVLADHRLIDLTGQTSLSESIEILKRSSGYIGIDSWSSILASQLLPAESLQIRTQNPVVSRNPWNFYSPHKTFPFLVPVLGGNPYPIRPRVRPNLDNRFVMLTEGLTTGNRFIPRGQVVEVSEATRDRLLESDQGVEVWQGEEWEVTEGEPGCRIKLLTRWATSFFNFDEGTVLEVTESVAEGLIHGGHAEPWEGL